MTPETTPQTRPAHFQGTPATCDGCHQPFTRRRRWQRFCKAACRRIWHRTIGDAAWRESVERRLAAIEAAIAAKEG